MKSAFVKLDRAKFHRDSLSTEVGAYRARDPYDWVMRQSNHPTDKSLTIVEVLIDLKEEMPPIWAPIVGDVLTNLRAALDHSIFGHAAGRQSLAPKVERNLAYPLYTDLTYWSPKKIELAALVDPAVLSVIDKSQPLHRPVQDGGPDWHPLAVLDNLVRQDKHRTIRTVSSINEKFSISNSKLPVTSIEDDTPVEIRDGVTVATVTLQMPAPKAGPIPIGRPDLAYGTADLDIENVSIELIELPVVNDTRPLLWSMDQMCDAVEKVLNDLQAAGC